MLLSLPSGFRQLEMNFKGIKNKLRRFKSLFEEHWEAFIGRHPRYNTDYYHAEIKKMLTCSSSAGGFATYQCLSCGKGEHKVNFSCKGKACPQCGKQVRTNNHNGLCSRCWYKTDEGKLNGRERTRKCRPIS